MIEAPAFVERRRPSCSIQLGTYLGRHELAEHSVLAYSDWSARDDWAFEGPDGPVSVTTHPCIRSNNGDICRAGALQHQGIILQPTFIVGGDLAAGRLVEVLPSFQAGSLDIYAMYGSRKHVSPKVRMLIDLLVEWFSVARWEDPAERRQVKAPSRARATRR